MKKKIHTGVRALCSVKMPIYALRGEGYLSELKHPLLREERRLCDLCTQSHASYTAHA